MPLLLLNKPYRVLSQFRDAEDRPTLQDFIDTRGVYPAGRLDFDSEGLLLLTDDGRLQARIGQPEAKTIKTYWVQVEGIPTAQQLSQLKDGVDLQDGPAQALYARLIDEPEALWARVPPIRHRVSVPDRWIEMGISEGRNRQVRRMTAAVGLPTLRLIRYAVGPWSLDGLQPGQSRSIPIDEAWEQIRCANRQSALQSPSPARS